MAIKEEKKRGRNRGISESYYDVVEPISQSTTAKDVSPSFDSGIAAFTAPDHGSIDPNARIKTIRGTEGQDIYKNTNIDQSKYGKAIYSDTGPGATQVGFNQDIKKYGIGATGLDAEGQSTGTYTPFSQPVQSPEMQQKAGGIEMAGVNPVGAGSPYGQNQYGNVGQGTNGITVIGQGGAGDWWNKPRNQRGGAFGQAQKIMDRMPYGSPGDRAERKSQLEQARVLMGMGISQARNQTAANRLAYEQQFGAEKLAQEYGQAGIENQLAQEQLGISGINAEAARLNAMKEGKPVMPYDPIEPTAILDAEGYPLIDESGKPRMTPAGAFNKMTGERRMEGNTDEQIIAGSTNPANQNTNAIANQVMEEVASGKIKKGDKEAATKRYDELKKGQGRNVN